MTDVEKQLKKEEDYGYKLCKYYSNGEERDKHIPDVLDRLYDMQDVVEDKRKQLAARIAADSHDTQASRLIGMWNRSYKEIMTAIDKVQNSTCTYFYMVGEPLGIDIEVIEILEDTIPITEAVVENGSIKLKETGDVADVYIVTDIDTDTPYRFISAEKYMHNDKLVIFNADYVNIGGYYAGVQKSVLDRTFICKECGKAFTLPEHVIVNYRRKKLDLPKRCYSCIQARKAARMEAEEKSKETETA